MNTAKSTVTLDAPKTKVYGVRFTYLMVCETEGYTIEAESEDEAAEKAAACVTKDGFFDQEAFESAGGNCIDGSWGTLDGSDHNYALDDESIEEEAQ